MLTVSRAGVLAIRAGFIILVFLGVALLIGLSKAILPESFLGGAIRYGVGVLLIFHALDFSKRIGEPGGWLNRVLADRAREVKPASVLMTDAAGLDTQDIDDDYFAKVAKEMNQDFTDEGPWAKACALAQGDESKQKSLYVELRARKLLGEHEAERKRVREKNDAKQHLLKEAVNVARLPEQLKRLHTWRWFTQITWFLSSGVWSEHLEDNGIDPGDIWVLYMMIGFVVIHLLFKWRKNHLMKGQPKHQNVSTTSADHQNESAH